MSLEQVKLDNNKFQMTTTLYHTITGICANRTLQMYDGTFGTVTWNYCSSLYLVAKTVKSHTVQCHNFTPIACAAQVASQTPWKRDHKYPLSKGNRHAGPWTSLPLPTRVQIKNIILLYLPRTRHSKRGNQRICFNKFC